MTEYYQIENGILERYTGREEVIEIPEGIHTIGEGALKGCVSLKKVILPRGLKCISPDAFKGCRKLEEVVIPEGVTYIGRYAFHRCHSLKRVVLPLSVQELGECAFLYCDSLQEVQMPGVKRLGMAALANGMSLEKLVISRAMEKDCIGDVFTGCARVKEIAFADGETYFLPNVVEAAADSFFLPPLIKLVVQDIVLRMMELEYRTLVRFRINIKHVEVPEGIEVLAKSSFYDLRGIVDIKLPQSLRQIESRAFRNCIGLEQVILHGDTISIDKDAFRNCTALRSIQTSDGSVYLFHGLSDIFKIKPNATQQALVPISEVPEPVRVIHRQVLGNFRMSGTILLQYLGAESRVIIPEGVTRIAEEAFAGIETIDKVILPESLQEIGAEAFRGCLLLQTITLPKELRSIDAGAFSDCVKLLRIEVPEQIHVLPDRIFRNCRALQEVCLSEGLEQIGERAFYGCQSLKKLTLPENLTRIGKMAFYRCGLREIRLPAAAEFVEDLAFAKSSLQKAQIMGGYGTGKHYGIDVFGDCTRLKTLVLEEGVCHIPDKFAYGCTALTRLSLPQTLKSIGRHAVEGSRFLEQWKQHTTETENTILWDGQHLEGEVQIPATVTIIAGGAFYGNTKITTIYIPEQVQSIGSAAFKGCTALQKVFFPSKIIQLAPEIFAGCSVLEEIFVTDSLDKSCVPEWHSIGERAFYQCRNLQKIQLAQTVKIEKEAFYGCAALQNNSLNPALWAGESAFTNTMLAKHLENGLSIVGSLIVSGIDCVGEIKIPDGIKGISPYAFAANRAVNKIVFPESLQWIGEGAFFGCSSLQPHFSKQLHTIEAHAFEKCSALKKVQCAVYEIGEAAFAGCTALIWAQFSQIKHLKKRLFAGCTNLETCLCQNVEEIQSDCFNNCTRLKEYDFTSISYVGKYAFANCESLLSVTFQDGIYLDAHAMEDCSHLAKICLSGPQGLISLKEYALSGCTSLCEVMYQEKSWVFGCYADLLSDEIPETVKLLYHSALSCFSVENEENLTGYRGSATLVCIPAGIKRIEAEVFRDAMQLCQVKIPESVEYIGARAFHGTTWMIEKRKVSPMVTVRDMLLDGSCCVGKVIVPPEIRLVCGWAFANGLGIKSIQFLSDRVQVEEYAFRNCIYLQQMILSDKTVVSFTGLADREKDLPPLAKQAVLDSLNCFKANEEHVLVECTGNISRMQLANGITEIGEGTFQDANLLTEITFSKTVKKIGKRAFAGCKWLREVRQASGVKYIEAHAFSGCQMLRFVEFSNNLRQIGTRAFENCTSLAEIQIPEGVEEIPERAFYRCHSLRSVQLPSTIKKIGKEAFAFCGKSLVVPVPEGIEVAQDAFRNC